MAGISDKALKTPYAENKYRFNGGSELQNKEFSDGSGLEMYDADFRGYDPQVGRFWQIDPLAYLFVEWSPYTYSFDNPIFLNDPFGLAPDSSSSASLVPAGLSKAKVQDITDANPNGSKPDVAAAAGPAPTSVSDPIPGGSNVSNSVNNGNEETNPSGSDGDQLVSPKSFVFTPMTSATYEAGISGMKYSA